MSRVHACDEPQALDLFDRSPRDAAIDALHAATAIYTCEPIRRSTARPARLAVWRSVSCRHELR